MPACVAREQGSGVRARRAVRRHVRPVLSEHCYECHSAKAKKIKGDILLDRRAGWEDNDVVTPGEPDKSDLIKMIEHDSDFEEMPPKDKLKPEEIAILREWIQRGAPDPRNEKVGDELVDNSFDLEERKTWWSLQALQDVKPPTVANESWVSTDLDHFILKALEDKSWKPAPKAGREQLLRRASVTLTGLAPTEQELAEHWSLTHDEFELVRNRTGHSRIGFAALLT